MFRKRRYTRAQLEQEFLNLDFTSDFLFSELMKDEELCKKLIETLLKIKVQKIVYHKTQKAFRHRSDGRGLPVYTVRNFIEEKKDFEYNDKCYKFFYNAKAWKSCGDTEVQGFLKYISTREPSTAFTNEIAARINDAHENPRLKEHFMTLKMKIDEEREEARLEGIALGLAKGAHDKAVEMAKLMLANNIDAATVVKCTGLPAEELDKLKVQDQKM